METFAFYKSKCVGLPNEKASSSRSQMPTNNISLLRQHSNTAHTKQLVDGIDESESLHFCSFFYRMSTFRPESYVSSIRYHLFPIVGGSSPILPWLVAQTWVDFASAVSLLLVP
jgi:hypothetical protein